MQMRDDNCSHNTEIAVGPRRRKKRGKLLYSSRRVLQRSRMRSTKHMSRLTAVEELVGVRIDFSGEEVTNLASLHEVVAAVDATQAIIEDSVKAVKCTATQSAVRHYPLIKDAKPIRETDAYF